LLRKAIWHRLAQEDLIEAFLFIGADSPAAAERLLDAVEEAVELLRSNPQAGRPCELRSARAADVRSWVVRGFESYLVFYRPAGQHLEIVRFLHGARDIPSLLEGTS
jgi:toxin ParE1/3/4